MVSVSGLTSWSLKHNKNPKQYYAHMFNINETLKECNQKQLCFGNVCQKKTKHNTTQHTSNNDEEFKVIIIIMKLIMLQKCIKCMKCCNNCSIGSSQFNNNINKKNAVKCN